MFSMNAWLLAIARAIELKEMAQLAEAERPLPESFTDLDDFSWCMIVGRAQELLEERRLRAADRLTGELAHIVARSHLISAGTGSELLALASQVAVQLGELSRAARSLLVLSAFLDARLGPHSVEQREVLRQLEAILAEIKEPELQALTDELRDRLHQSDRQVLGPADSSIPASIYADQKKHLVEVYYATHRERTTREDVGRYYGGRRGPLQFGVASVVVTPNPDLEKVPTFRAWTLEYRKKWSDRAYLQAILPTAAHEFYRNVSKSLDRSRRRELLLFVHGFNVSFRGATEALGALAVDLDLDGVPVLYSWPSQGNILSYFVDRNNVIRDHVDALAMMFLTLSAIDELGPVTLIAHSMGNHFLLSALERTQQTLNSQIARTLIFASPDVDRTDFISRTVGLLPCAERATLYASCRDRALWLSELLQAYERAGDAQKPVIVDGLDTVDTTDVAAGFVGHSDYAGAALDDLRSQVWFNLPPSERIAILEEAISDEGAYWKIAPTRPSADVFGMALVLCRRLGPDALAYADQLVAAAPNRPTQLAESGRQLRTYIKELLNRAGLSG